MTELLERAFRQAALLPPTEQDELAQRLLDDLEAEERFDAKIAATAPRLVDLARRAREDRRAGRTQPLDLDADFQP